MAQIPHVQSGEVIRANVINTLIDQVNALGSGAPGPGVTVPNVIGRPLSQARTMITQPSVNLSLGLTIDASGVLVDPNAPASATRIVIMQSPPAGTRATVGSAVDLALATLGPGPSPQPKPVINSLSASSRPIGQPVTILGDNFDLSAANNQVTFNGTAAGVPSPASKTSLTVLVPPLASPPVSATIVVTTPAGGSSNGFSITVTAPLGTPNPTISSIDVSPNPIAVVGQTITINGTNFDATTPANNKVLFDAVQVDAATATATKLTVVVPNIPGVILNQPPTQVSIVVKIGANQSFPTFPLFVVKV
jgi:hypothetical protein